MPKIIKDLIKTCMGYKKGESILILTDVDYYPEAVSFFETAKKFTDNITLLCIPTAVKDGDEPPFAATNAMKAADIVFLITKYSMSYTEASRQARNENKTRIASIPGIPKEHLIRLIDLDYETMNVFAEKLKAKLEGVTAVRLVTEQGTDLEFEIKDRQINIDVGDLKKPGSFGNFPAGEVSIAPIEGTANGKLVVDGTLSMAGFPKHPIVFEIKGGKIESVTSTRVTEFLARSDKNASMVAEFGIGINPKAFATYYPNEGVKAAGTVHIGFGNNLPKGGKLKSNVHFDGVLLAPQVYLDGKKFDLVKAIKKHYKRPDDLIQKRDELIDYAEELRLFIGKDLYELMFRQIKFPLYVLDLKQQTFIEVNKAFCEFSGYTREELLNNKVLASDLVASEEKDRLKVKIAERKSNPTERYQMKLITKSGEIKHVEINVRYTQLRGRDAVMGVINDITKRVVMENNLRDKILGLASSNMRIHTLTEKLRNVPTMTQQLLNVQSEKEIYEKASKMFCDRQGLAYKHVSFYEIDGENLKVAFTTKRTARVTVKLNSNHRYARVAKTLNPYTSKDGLEIVLAMKGRRSVIGIIKVLLSKKEKEVIEGSEIAVKGYYDVLYTLSNMIGLIIENRRLYERVEKQSVRDRLTQVYNRRYFDRRYKDEVRRAVRYKRDLALFMIDLDNFKDVNDNYGHRQGDVVLHGIASILSKFSREVDVVCRYGGDEFVVLMPETSPENSAVKATILRKKIADAAFESVQGKHKIKVTASIGVSGLNDKIRDEEVLFDTVDEACYEAKRSGRNKVMVWGQY